MFEDSNLDDKLNKEESFRFLAEFVGSKNVDVEDMDDEFDLVFMDMDTNRSGFVNKEELADFIAKLIVENMFVVQGRNGRIRPLVRFARPSDNANA